MEHNKILKKWVPTLRKSWIVWKLHQIHILKEKKHRKIEMGAFKNFYEKNKGKFKEVLNLLADVESKETYKAVLSFRMTWNSKTIKKYTYFPQYFVKEIFDSYNDEVFVDGGAYNGDTIAELLKYMPQGSSIKKIYAWEPDEINGKLLLNEYGKKNNVVWLPYAMYKCHDNLRFTNSGTEMSAVDEKGDLIVQADCIDNLSPDATFIKMDIEGAEIDALYGAKETIIRNKPKLAICIYHKPEHLYQIPLLIHEWVPEYKLYIRHHSHYDSETVLYARL
jgi:FkbM family methyltransferase